MLMLIGCASFEAFMLAYDLGTIAGTKSAAFFNNFTQVPTVFGHLEMLKFAAPAAGRSPRQPSRGSSSVRPGFTSRTGRSG